MSSEPKSDIPIDDFSLKVSKEVRVLFITSTCGQGAVGDGQFKVEVIVARLSS